MSDDATLATANAIVHQPDSSTAPSSFGSHLDELAREVLELKLAALNETNAAEASVKRMQSRLWRLKTALVVVFTVFGGMVTWQALSLRQQQVQWNQLQTQLAAIDTSQPEVIQQLSDELEDVQQQIPDNLSRALEQNQEDIATLQSGVEELTRDIGDRQKALAVLTRALQALVAEESGEPPAASSSESVESAASEAEAADPEP